MTIQRTRLKLDFNLPDYEARARYVKYYLWDSTKSHSEEDKQTLEQYKQDYADRDFPFVGKPTQSEAEMIGNYILWGKDKETGKSIVDDGMVEIQNRGVWNKVKDESLEGAMEDSEINFTPFELKHGAISNLGGKRNGNTKIKAPKPVLDRAVFLEAAKQYDEYYVGELEMLWEEIDFLDYAVTVFEIRTGKRKKAISEVLKERVQGELRNRAIRKGMAMSSYDHTKLKRLLIEKRKEQYVIKDIVLPTIRRGNGRVGAFTVEDNFEASVYPLKRGRSDLDREIFQIEVSDELLRFRKEELADWLSRQNDKAVSDETSAANYVIDFTNSEHIAALVYLLVELKEVEDSDMPLTFKDFFIEVRELYYFYKSGANLGDVPMMILDLKEKGLGNSEIRKLVNEAYGTTYAENYISTIFTHQSCQAIADFAQLHYDSLGILVGEDGHKSFRRCNDCGRRLLLDNRNYNTQSSRADGFAAKCKVCRKKDRDKRKEVR